MLSGRFGYSRNHVVSRKQRDLLPAEEVIQSLWRARAAKGRQAHDLTQKAAQATVVSKGGSGYVGELAKRGDRRLETNVEEITVKTIQ